MNEVIYVVSIVQSVDAGGGDDTVVLQIITSGYPNIKLDGGSGFDVFDASSVLLGQNYTFFTDAEFEGRPGFTVGDFDVIGFEKIFGSSNGGNWFLLQYLDHAVELHGGSSADWFGASFAHADTFHGYGGDDEFSVRPLDKAYGGSGRDTFKPYEASGDFRGSLIDGGSGQDLLALSFGWTVDLDLGVADSPFSGTLDSYQIRDVEDVEVFAWRGYRTVVSGSGAANVLSVNPDRDDGSVGVSFAGRAGNDTLSGSTSSDTLDGGEGDDLILAGDGDDSIIAGEGNDTISGGFGDDTVEFMGAAGDYCIVLSDAGYSVTAKSGSGTASISADVEHLMFGGKPATIRADSDNQFVWDWQMIISDGFVRTVTMLMDTGRHLTSSYEGGVRRSYVAEDLGDEFSWSKAENTYGAGGAIKSRAVSYDDGRLRTDQYGDDGKVDEAVMVHGSGRVDTTSYAGGVRISHVAEDLGDEFSWSRIENTYGAGGAIKNRAVSYDDGRLRTDQYGDDGKVHEAVMVHGSGRVDTTSYVDGVRRSYVVEDLGDEFSWSKAENTYGAGGAIESRVVTYDDGQVREWSYTEHIAEELLL